MGVTDPGQEGWSAIDLNGTGISMYPAPAAKMMVDIAKILKDLRDGWTTAEGQISSLEGNLGQGPMGEPFREQYNKAVEQLRKYMPDMVENLSELSDAGTKAVPMYVDADFRAGQHFEF